MQSGQVFESHLTGLAVVTVYVMTHGSIRHSTESVRGREATPSIYFNQNMIDTQIQHVFNTEFDPVFAVRMILALRFDSQSGSLLVADLWGDTKYKPFISAKARELLSPTTPLIAIANAARAQASETPGSQVTASVIGNEPTQTLTKGARLTSRSSYSRKDCSVEWIFDENLYRATDARAVYRNYLQVQKQMPSTTPQHARKLNRRMKRIITDDPTGIAAIEVFLAEQAKTQ